MANELKLAGDPGADSGLTVTATVYDGAGTVVGSAIPCSEVGVTAIYIGDMPAAAAGNYLVRFFDGNGAMLAQNRVLWDGTQELTGNPAVDLVEGSETVLDVLRLLRAEAAGKLIVFDETVRFRDAADTKDRIVAVVDRYGQRSSIVTDAS